ncbi:MAG: 2-phospho-L-lactate guanylyltransferase [Candidatus Dormibacteria bacterium]
MIYAVVPIKAFRSAKTRLGAALDEPRRAHLARASAARVLRAVAGCPSIDRRIAVVEDSVAADMAARERFEVLLRPDLWGQSAAVECGFDLARERGATTLLTVSADVPLVRPVELDRLLEGSAAVLVLAPDRGGRGTNALRISPATNFRLHFGPDSLALHRREGEAAGLPVRILRDDRLRLDIDTPDDLDLLEKVGPEGRAVLADAGRWYLDDEREAVLGEKSV